MKQFMVLAQTEVTAQALLACLRLAGEEIAKDKDRKIVFSPQRCGDAGVGDYKTLVNKITSLLASCDDGLLSDTTILVDSIHPDNLNAVSGSGSWENLVAMLILTFPDVRWLFGVVFDYKRVVEFRSDPFPDHVLFHLFPEVFREPLLDPTGLREWVRKKTNTAIEDDLNEDLELPLRDSRKLAAAIDDEHYFAYFNAYTAYRFGCRADVVTSWLVMEHLFKPPKPDQMAHHPYWLLLEDMSLNFPDRPPSVHLSKLEDRAEKCPLLGYEYQTADLSTHRVLVTGQIRPRSDTLKANKKYLRMHKQKPPQVVLKPVSGMFDLWQQMGLLGKRNKRKRVGNVDGYKWPPDLPPKENTEPKSGHGTMGKLLLVAETLIHRAEVMRIDTTTPMEKVLLGAVMATDALELTGGRTPTTAIEALALKHRFEVMMECLFLGNEYNILVAERFDELEFDLKRITRWTHYSKREKTVMNAKMSIIVQIMRVFRDYGQFDEELLCLKHTRDLNRRLFFAKKPGLILLYPLRWYIDKLVGSISLLVSALVVWPVLLGGLMALLGTSWNGLNDPTLIDHITNAFYMFIAQAPAGFPQGFWAHLFTFGAPLVGLIHFGIFITYLYNLFYRR